MAPTERDFATDVVRRLQFAGYDALWAGGCVRDELLGLVPADYDVATSARPEQVQTLFRRCVAVGASFGVIEVIGPRTETGDHLKVQVATFRSDGTYTDGRRPDAVTFSTPEHDAARRDFTINGMFLDPVSSKISDYVGGEADLRAGILRAIGKPEERFAEDKLRVLRAVRMAARFRLAVDPATLAAARSFAARVTVVSPERIGDELRKILYHPTRADGVARLDDFGLAGVLFPECESTKWPEAARGVAALVVEETTFPVAFAAMTAPFAAGKILAAICRRFRLSNDEAECIQWLSTNRDALAGAQTLPRSRLYPLLASPGIRDLLTLFAGRVRLGIASATSHAFARHVLETTTAVELCPRPLITGDDLVSAGWQPGKRFKAVLETIRAEQLDGKLSSLADGMRRAMELET